MAYLALYREWRPQSFREIVGQEHITRTLQNALAFGRVSHAYLFCGPRGTGKTTTAKVLAKALNCRSRRGAEPCNACASCLEITNGNSLDVIEIDAASHRGIDEIRDLREKVRFSPTAGGYRVYIIDEVHMLTQEAFNALLKTLEEPPAHIVFILATTEPQKVPLTILSRCQRFDFHRIGMQPLLLRLREVCRGAGLEVSDDALYLIARAAEGGLRDALSILDQVAAFGEKRVTAEDIHRVLGTVREEMLDEIIGALDCGDAAKTLRLIRSLVEQGKELRLFVRELLARLRSLLLLLVSPDLGDELSPHERERLSAQANALGKEKLLLLLDILSRTEQDMRWSTQPGILLEVALVQAIRAGGAGEGAPGGDLARRVARLEELVAALAGERQDVDLPRTGREKEGAESKEIGDNKEAEGKAEDKNEHKDDKGKGSILSKEGIGRKENEEEGSREPEGESERKDGHPGKMGAKTDRGTRGRGAGSGLKSEEAPAGGAMVPGETKKEKGASRAPAKPKDEGEGPAFQEVASRWKGFLEALKKDDPPLYSFLTYGWPQQLSSNTLIIAFAKEYGLYKDYLEGKLKDISRAVNSFFVRSWEVRLSYGERPRGMDFSPENQELSTEEALSLFGVREED